jgi:predicted RNase H-like HicB family nuclease
LFPDPAKKRRIGRIAVISSFMARYTKIERGYLGQLVAWPEVVTEGKTLEECREMQHDALEEMIAAYRDMGRAIPAQTDTIEPLKRIPPSNGFTAT